jgi:hypothetical protein
MYEKIRFEWFIIKEVITATCRGIKNTRSLRPIVNLLRPCTVFKVEENGPYIKGNYYKYIKNKYVA